MTFIRYIGVDFFKFGLLDCVRYDGDFMNGARYTGPGYVPYILL